MFDILFGWRKASKCKRLIRQVQCRLKLLKNKRCSIVRQLRDDVAQLLRHGHDQIAFNRVEQIYKDESIVAVYDLLDHFCEFIIINLPYIRRHKDVPNDVNEAVSTLIFASARCGDLPELRVIRKLFGERYGQRFATTALELLPGNLVNRQIIENLSITSVSDDVKYKLVDEIFRTSLQQGPLAIEYSSELHRQQESEKDAYRITKSNDRTNHSTLEGSQMFVASKGTETEGKIVYISFLFNDMKVLPQQRVPQTTAISSCSSVVLDSSAVTTEFSIVKEEDKIDKFPQLNDPSESIVSGKFASERSRLGKPKCVDLEPEEPKMAAQSSSESPSQLPEETVYLDDIKEIQSPISKDGTCQGQSLFVFIKPSVLSESKKFQDSYYGSREEPYEPLYEKGSTRSSGKSGKPVGKKSRRRRSISQEKKSLKDVEYESYYGESSEDSPNLDSNSVHHKRLNRKISTVESHKSCIRDHMRSSSRCSFDDEMVDHCSLDRPCYFCADDYRDDTGSPSRNQKVKITNLEKFPAHESNQGDLHCKICRFRDSRYRKPIDRETGCPLLPHKPQKNYPNGVKSRENSTYSHRVPNEESKKLEGELEESESLGSRASVCSCLSSTSQWTRTETQPPYLRAMTMPPERLKDRQNDNNILRSNSFPFKPTIDSISSRCPSPHVHPKLPDYDELAAKFRALKEANLQNKQESKNQKP